MLFTTLLLAATGALALPTTRTHTKIIAFNQATYDVGLTMTANGQGLYWGYEVHIGRSYLNGAGCDAIHKTLSEADTIQDWSCKNHGWGNTMLGFGGTYDDEEKNQKVMEALGRAYPAVPFVREGTCVAKVL